MRAGLRVVCLDGDEAAARVRNPPLGVVEAQLLSVGSGRIVPQMEVTVAEVQRRSCMHPDRVPERPANRKLRRGIGGRGGGCQELLQAR